MPLRAYLTLLRPWRTLASTALLLFICAILMASLGVSLKEGALVFCCVVAPLAAGLVLIAPLYEAAHRSSFPLLPAAPRKFRDSHFVAFVFAALLLFGLCAAWDTSIPAPAAGGLILAGLALPLLAPGHSKTIGINPWFGFVLITVVATATTSLARDQLVALGQAAPWLLFFGGLAFACACFRLGFSRDRLRARSANPCYYAPQSTLLFVDTDILQQAQVEAAQLDEQRSTRPSAAWSAAPFHNTLGDWLRIVHQARFGRSRLARNHWSVFAGTFVGTVTALLVSGVLLAVIEGEAWSNYCRLVVETARTSGEIVHSEIRLWFILVSTVSFATVLTGVIQAGVPAQPFPLARTRLANVLFLAFECRLLLALAGCIVGTATSLAAAALVAQQPWNLALLHRFWPLPAVALIVSNLLPLAVFSGHLLSQFAFWLLAYPGYIIASLIILHRGGGPSPSLAGLAILAALALGSVAFAWSTFRRHYRTCDLTHTCNSLGRLGLRSA